MTGFIGPVPGFGRVTSGFGMRDGKMHRGIDIGRNLNPPAPIDGAEIVAVADGYVSGLASMHDSMGNMLELNHGGGARTRYMHNRVNFVGMGDIVRQGDVIALVGNTGRSSAPHLHFELIIDGAHVDPLRFVDLSAVASPVVLPCPVLDAGFVPSCSRPSLLARLFGLLGRRFAR